MRAAEFVVENSNTLPPESSGFHKDLLRKGWKYVNSDYSEYEPYDGAPKTPYAQHRYEHPVHGKGTVGQDKHGGRFFPEPKPKPTHVCPYHGAFGKTEKDCPSCRIEKRTGKFLGSDANKQLSQEESNDSM